VRRASLSFLLAIALLVTTGSAVVAASPSGHGTTTVRYTAGPYFDFVIGAVVVCKGIHQYGPRWPGTATTGGRDVYRCTSVSGPFTNISHQSGFTYPTGAWFSDYLFFSGGGFAVNILPIHLHISGNGLSYQAIAIYSEP
jgi:hypothetical protein